MDSRFELKWFRTLIGCLLCACMLSVSAHAELYIFGKISSGETPALCPEAFTMEVQDQGGQALFTFTNNCDSDGVLSRIFFRKNDLMTFNSFTDASEGVEFHLNEKKAMLPDGHQYGFTPHNTFSIDADPARPKNGLHYEDYLSVLFDLSGGVSYADLIAAIDHQSLGIGLHAQSLPGGMSASFVTIPEPITFALMGIGTLMIRHKRRGTAQ